MSMSISVKKFPEVFGVDQITIVRKGDSIWTVDVEWLSFSAGAAAGSRVSQVSQAHETWKILDARSVVEDFCSHAIPLALVYASA
jgi:hypothetical protein